MTDVYESIRRLFVPIRREGYPFIAIAFVAALILGFVWTPLFWVLLVVTLWVCYFFRDPERVTPVRDGLVVSPADGRISMISNAVPPTEMGLPMSPCCGFRCS
jgi:phosphatidylserine decarboxylase